MELLGIGLTEKEFDFLMCEQNKGKEIKVIDNKLVACEVKPTHKDIIENLREIRKTECFSIVNRGLIWYNTLTNEQINELDLWYKAWLDVTKTEVVPTKPNWL